MSMKFKVEKAELIYSDGGKIVTRTPVEVDSIKEYRQLLRETHDCDRVLLVYEEIE